MIKTRVHHWTCSKFADWVRGEKKPYALELHKWEEWRKEQKEKRPIRFWLSDTLLGYLQDIIHFPTDVFHTIKFYTRNRFIEKVHYLKTGLPPGQWIDFDERILHGLFNELVDFVEKELAHLSKWDKNKKYKFKKGRCVEAAYDYFKWAKDLKDDQGAETQQAKAARITQNLYEWWKIKRPNRLDPIVESNVEKIREITGDDSKETREAYSNFFEIEERNEKEDTEMLIELIKIRKSFWT